jgi:site-specific recombinase
MVGDGGTGNFPWLLTPISDVKTRAERLYNFFHSSTRMIVEQTFGIWKNRFRCLMHEMHMDHWLAVLIIQTTMVLHNMCRVHKEDDYMDQAGDEVVLEYLRNYNHGMCPDCKRLKKLHCIHSSMSKIQPPTHHSNATEFRATLVEKLWARHGEDDHDFY